MLKLTEYQKGQIVSVLIENHRTSGREWRTGTVVDKGMIYPTCGSKHPPYPKVLVEYYHSYYNNNETKEFYEKKAITMVISADELVVFNGNINNKVVDKLSVWISRDSFTYEKEKQTRFKVLIMNNNIVHYFFYHGEFDEIRTNGTQNIKDFLETMERYLPVPYYCM